jgi:HD-like signal output (HDOD) protein
MTASDPIEIIGKVGELPTLPEIYSRIAELTSDPDTGAKDLERVIENDQALASKLLKLVNSAFFGFPSEIRTISRAVMIVGFKALSQLAMSASVLNLFPKGDQEVLDFKGFWRHSIGVAVMSRHIAIEEQSCAPEEIFLSGLLHDIGILVLSGYLPDEFSEAVGLAKNHGLHLHEAERKVLGFDHTDTGNALAVEWRLPMDLAEAVANHHVPTRAGPPTVSTSIVHVACALCTAAGVGCEGVDVVPPISRLAWEATGMTPTKIGGILEGVDDEIALFMEMIDS